VLSGRCHIISVNPL